MWRGNNICVYIFTGKHEIYAWSNLLLTSAIDWRDTKYGLLVGFCELGDETSGSLAASRRPYDI